MGNNRLLETFIDANMQNLIEKDNSDFIYE